MGKPIFIVSSKMKLDLVNFKVSLGEVKKNVGEAAKTIEKRLNNISRSLTSMGKKMSLWSGIVGAGLLVGFKKLLDTGGDLSDLSKQLNISTAALSELQYAISLSGVSMEELVKGIQKMEKVLGEGGSDDVLAKLGLDPASLKKAAPDVVFMKIIDALGKISNQNVKMDLAQAIFGKGGGVFLRLAKDGAAGIEALREEARALGVSIDENTAGKLDEMGDNLDRLRARTTGLWRAFLILLIPSFDKLLNTGRDVILWVKNFTTENRDAIQDVTKLGLAVLSLNFSLGLLSIGLGDVLGLIAGSYGIIRKMTMLTWAQNSANIAASLSAIGWMAAIGLIAFGVAMINDRFRDYIRNLSFIRKATDFFFIAFVNGWENVKYGVSSIFDRLIFEIKDKLLLMQSIATDTMAQIIDTANVFGIEKLSKTADSLRQKSLDADKQRQQNRADLDQRNASRRDTRDRNVSAAYDSSIFGDQGQAEIEAAKARRKSAGAGQEPSKTDAKLVSNSDKQCELLNQLISAIKDRGLGLNKLDVGID